MQARSRTYMTLASFLEAYQCLVSNESHRSNDKLTTLLSIFYLIDSPFFDQTAHTPSSIQTFYANHYLREITGVSSLPLPSVLLDYALSDDFGADLFYISTLASKHKSWTIENDFSRQEFYCRQDIANPHVLSLSPHSATLISFIDSLAVESDSAAYITGPLEPSQSIFDQIKNRGFAIQDNFLTPSVLAQISQIFDQICAHELRTKNAYLYGENGANQRVYNLVAKHPIFQDLITCPYIVNVCNRVFDRPTFHEKFGLNSLTGHIVAPGSPAIPWHLDSVVPEPLPEWMVRFICILPLDDFTPTNGATEFVPASHLQRRRPTPEDVRSLTTQETAVCPAGSLVLFDGATWHHSSANRTSLPRRGLMLSFGSSLFMELCGEEEHLTVIPQKTIHSFTPKLKQMIGYQRAIKRGAQTIDESIYSISLQK
ncbi:phytanoyl-CoA dioxygenase family protein [Synechococcus sp. W4D4]|uniref:phytanoyl-CoA dioxygenase family protein n=1 Tax=Synechococcus sp. W4D4 TaxID=3392294 RepID=UPI0039EC1C59